MNWIFRNRRKAEPAEVDMENSGVESKLEPNQDRNRFKPLPWLVSAVFIFGLLYGSSYLALLWLPAYAGPDMKSHIALDYSPWSVLVFQPVDPAIIEEIQQEQGLPEQIIINGSSWPTPTNTHTTVETQQPNLTAPPATSATVLYSPTALPPTNSTYVSTPGPTIVVSPQNPTATPRPTQVAKPTKTRKPPKTQKPPRPPKP